MVVNPHDLVMGRGEDTSESVTAARAARRELTGIRQPNFTTDYTYIHGCRQNAGWAHPAYNFKLSHHRIFISQTSTQPPSHAHILRRTRPRCKND